MKVVDEQSASREVAKESIVHRTPDGKIVSVGGYSWAASPDVIWASAGDYYPAIIETGPKFGCIHHEPK